MEYTFDTIRNNGRLLYEYIRGSQSYGLSLPTSDEDHGAVFIMDTNDVFGISQNKVDQVNDERNDTTWYEVGKYIELLAKGNPNMLESVFVPERCVLYMHPAFKVIYDNRDKFVSKETFSSFVGYAKSQIEKARGLNKKIVNPVDTRKDILDFCYTFKGQGTTPFKDWLNDRGLKAKYCGLVHLPNMEQMYGVYYDWGNHFKHEGINEILDMKDNLRNYIMSNQVCNHTNNRSNDLHDWFMDHTKLIGYRGAMDENNDTTQLRLSSVEKNEEPICIISYNENGFKTHCRQYKEYQEWVAKRNPQRYLENKDKEFDRKNMMHCVRLLTMGIEIAKTGKVNVDRTNIDREFLLNIRLGNTTYDEIISYAEKKQAELNEVIKTCTLPETVDMNEVNSILIKLRRQFN